MKRALPLHLAEEEAGRALHAGTLVVAPPAADLDGELAAGPGTEGSWVTHQGGYVPPQTMQSLAPNRAWLPLVARLCATPPARAGPCQVALPVSNSPDGAHAGLGILVHRPVVARVPGPKWHGLQVSTGQDQGFPDYFFWCVCVNKSCRATLLLTLKSLLDWQTAWGCRPSTKWH